MKQAPLILITPSKSRAGAEFADGSLSLSERYGEAILAAGGIPWVLPRMTSPQLAAECVRRSDGLMLTGGDDVNPKLYGAKLTAKLKRTVTLADPERDYQELLLIDAVFAQRKPLLAICRGHQILNVALGGTLIVDIPSQVPNALDHRRMDRKNEIVDEAILTPGSLLAKIAGRPTLGINSSHHQAIGRVADLLYTTAASRDGVNEAVELKPAARGLLPYLLSVQAHPERLFDRYAEHLNIFKSFVKACASGRKK